MERRKWMPKVLSKPNGLKGTFSRCVRLERSYNLRWPVSDWVLSDQRTAISKPLVNFRSLSHFLTCWLLRIRSNIFNVVLEFGDVKETTTEGDNKYSAADNTASYKSPDQLSDELVTLSLLPKSRWRHLTSLELIKVVDGVCVYFSYLDTFRAVFQSTSKYLILPNFFSEKEQTTGATQGAQSCSLLFAYHTGTGA